MGKEKEDAQIDYAILANHVEAINGLLYISGGGWSSHYRIITPGSTPPISHMGLGISIAIPWNAANRDHLLHLRLEDEDTATTILQTDVYITIGQPPHLPPGTEQHIAIAIPMEIVFPHQGGYRFLAALDDTAMQPIWSFRVHDIAAPGAS